jgi:hypothetical protein
MLRPTSLAALVTLATCTACGAPGRAARVGTHPDGGSVMLSANNDKAWDSAKEIMSSHCGGKYRILAQVQETTGGRGGPPPATSGAMADPFGPAGATYGIRVDYACTGGSGPLPPLPGPAPEQASPPAAPSQIPQTQTPAKGS